MRVLLVADVIGGVRTFTYELVRELVAREVEVHLALIGADAGALEDLPASSSELRDLRLEWMHDPWEDVYATAQWVAQLRERHRPDVVHMNTLAPVLDPDVPVVVTVHSCVLTWWRAVHGSEAPPAWRRYRRLVEVSLRRADLVTVPTHALRRELVTVYGELPSSAVVANGRRIFDGGLAQADRGRLVLTAGRLWDEAKNAAMVARAAPAIDGRVVMIGPGDGPVAGAVRSLGELGQGQVVAWMSRAAVFAEPARYEPFGLAALEAALCGCALVLGDIPTLREVWDDTAAYVSPDDPQALAHVVNTLLDNPVLRADAAGRARQRAQRYSPRVMAASYLDLYTRLARQPVPA